MGTRKIPQGKHCGKWIHDGTGMGNMSDECKHLDYYDGHWCEKYPDEMTEPGGMERDDAGVLKCSACLRSKGDKV